MKSGARAIGVAESYVANESTLAGVVVRADRIVEDFAFATCTVGGTDATDAIIRLWNRLDRKDIRYILIAGIAPAWFNILDLYRIRDASERPVISVSFEDSPGLADPINDAFDGPGAKCRVETYRAQPERYAFSVNNETVYARVVGINQNLAKEVIQEFTPGGSRPEPLRVAQQVARAVDTFRRNG